MFGVVFNCLECAACGQPGASYFAVQTSDYVYGRNLEGVQVFHPACVTKEFHAETTADTQVRNRPTSRGGGNRLQTRIVDSNRSTGHYGAPTKPKSLVLRMRLPSGYAYKSTTFSLPGVHDSGATVQQNHLWKGHGN